MKFTDLPLKAEILQALEEMGYEDLTPVQEQTFGPILEGRDLLALAETGSGKTSACGIPMVQNIDPGLRQIQALVLVPTRELALQYVDEIDFIGRHLDISPFAIYGGFSMDIQKAKLADGVHVLIATPGRLIDHLYNSDLSLGDVKTLVLDEADEMLDLGFVDDVKFIMSCIIGKHQTLLFSATMPKDIDALAAACMHNPYKVELNREVVAPVNLHHCFKMVSSHERITILKDFFKTQAPRQAIIFCNSRKNGEELHRKMKGVFTSIEYIHGGMDQSRRTAIFDNFKKMKTKLLIATDVAGRGLDFSHVTHILNFDFPQNAEIYTHRTGRTGRMGKHGTAITYVTPRDAESLRHLLKHNKIEPEWEGEVPDLHRIAKEELGKRKKHAGAGGKHVRGKRKMIKKNKFRTP
jgi:ATP-dependent RNA helicase DeaD